MVNVLSCEVVELVEVLLVASDYHAPVSVLHIDEGLVHHAAALLDELSHGVEVCGVVDAGREDALAILAFGFAVELLPPFGEVNEFRAVGDEDFDSLAVLAVKQVAHCCVLHGGVVLRFHEKGLALVGCSLKQGADVETGYADRQESYRGEHAETASHIVRNDKGLVAFLGGEGLEGALVLVGDGHDALGCLCLSVGLFYIFLENPESYCRLCGGS